MSEIRRGRRLRDIPQQMNGMGAAVPQAGVTQQYAGNVQRGTYPAEPGRAPEAEVRAVRTGEEEQAFNLGQQMGAAGIAGSEAPAEAMRKIGKDEIIKAIHILEKYKAGKQSVDRRIIRAQEWWKLRNWEMIQEEKGVNGSTVQKSATAWLWYSIVGKHADAMDCYPEPIILPRMQEDKAEAKILSEIIPVVLQLNKFPIVYSREQYQKLQEGTGAYHVGWDKSKLGGIGDINISKVSILQLFWEPGIEEIEDSANVFFTRLVDNDQLEQMYPQLKGKLGHAQLVAKSYRTDDAIDTSEKSVLVDWYYHRWDGPRKVLHYCQFVGEEILYSTENEGMQNGLYDDGEYPFVLDPLYEVQGSPAGYGYFDIGKDCQGDIDTINQAMVQNAVVTSTPRYFIQTDGGVNEDEFADWSKPFIHTSGMLGDQQLKPVITNGIQGNALTMLQNKIEELKFVTGNTDVNNGGTPSGVTAASAIAALQEQSGRTSKDTTRGAYQAYNKVIEKVIERIRQFYDIPRQFRILGPNGQEQFVNYSNAKLKEQELAGGMGMEPGLRKPVFDVEVRAQRENAYTKMSQNELAIQFLQLGVFNPQMTDQALMMLDMMDFKGKDELQQKVETKGTLQEELMKVAQIAMALAQKYEPAVANQLGAVLNGMSADAGMNVGGSGAQAEMPKLAEAEAQGKPSEASANVRKAKAQVQESTRVE